MSEQRPQTKGRHLNHVAWLYDPLVERMSFGRERRFREQTLAFMEVGPGARILDVGCGTGSLTLMTAARFPESGEVVGIDAAPKMIRIARRKAAKLGRPVRFEVGVAERLDFSDNSFDLVVNSMFMHHIDHELKEQALAEMLRVLKSGGRLVTADIDRPTGFWAGLLGWGGRYLLLQRELEDNLIGKLPIMMSDAGFVGVRKMAHLYNLVSFFVCEKP